MQAGAPGQQPAKTMFGYAAPVVPPGQRPGAAPQPGQPARPGQPAQSGFPPAQQSGFPPPQQPAPQHQGFAQQPAQPQAQPQAANPYGQPQQQANPYGQPQQQNPYGQPQQQNPYGQPQQANPYGQPQQQNPYGQPQQANPYGQPQQQNPYGQPQQAMPQQQNPYGQPQQNPYGQPQQQNPYGQPQQNPYGQPQQAMPQQQNPYGQPQQQNPYGQPQQNPYGQQPGYPQQGGYPQASNPYAQPQQESAGPLGDLAHKLPQSAPGTIFGFSVSRLRDPGLQKKILFLAGVALVASIVVPFSLDPLLFSWKIGGFEFFLWPIISGGLYLLLTAAPADLRAKVPPVVLQWIPFGVSYAGIFISHMGGMAGVGSLYILGYSLLVFGLLARIAQPQDQIARIIIAVGGACLIPTWIDGFRIFGNLGSMPILLLLTVLLAFIVITLGVLCILFVVPPAKLPPALQTIDAFGPLVAAVLIVWLPLQLVLLALATIVHTPGHPVIGAVLTLAHGLLPILAYFGVLMMASPAAYEEAKAMFGKRPGGGYPQGGGYPPQGGYPQGGGYPPQGGGYPPQGGGYPPQGGGYPPQQGGGWQ
jgi:hypothetical protein